MRLRWLGFLLVGVTALGLPPAALAQGPCANEGFREAQASTFLPDCRAYEMVSPPDKNGGDVIAWAERTRAAKEETAGLPMAVDFASLQGFGDVRGTGITSEYISERDGAAGTNGWSTHGITPPQTAQGITGLVTLADPMYEGEFSDDLSRGVFRAWSPLTYAPNVANVENLYSRTDLRKPGAGSYRLLSDCAACASPLSASVVKLALAGVSNDFSHVVFESAFGLTPDAGGCTPSLYGLGCAPKLYESIDGVPQLVGILPNGQPAAAGCPGALPCSVAGQGAGIIGFPQHYTPHAVSGDGARVLFTSPVTVAGVPTAASATGVNASKIYLRDTAAGTTVQVNASERAVPATERRALLWNASADLSRVFFTSREALTDEAPDTTETEHLYMWEAAAPVGHHLTMLDVDRNPSDSPGAVDGVIGVSDDGHYVYFLAEGQLVEDAPAGAEPESICGMTVVAHRGSTTSVAWSDLDMMSRWMCPPSWRTTLWRRA